MSEREIQPLTAGLEYAAKSWPVLPLHNPTANPDQPCSCRRAICPDMGKHPCHKNTCKEQGKHPCHQTVCESVGKHPRLMEWEKKATTDEATIREWLKTWPASNVGITTGPAFGWVLDVDPRHGGFETLAALEAKHGKLPETLTGDTGGDGAHIVFEYPDFEIKNLTNGELGPGLDVKAAGGQVVAPPSLHPSGKRYRWRNDAPIVKAPAWLLDLLREAITKKSPSVAGEVGEIITQPGRYAALNSLAGTMRRRGMDAEEITAALTAVNARRCSPPLDDGKIAYIAETISQHSPMNNGHSAPCVEPPEWWDSRTPANSTTASQIRVETALSRIVTAQTILATHYPEPKWAVKGLIPEGVTFIAGPPKLGKSIWALNIAVAVAEGGKALSHFEVERGAVLYLALEDGPRRIQERLLKLTNGRISDKLQVVTEWPRLNQGGLEAIEAWIERNKDARLLIVDTLKMLRPLATGRDRNVYDADYEAIQPLTKLASQRVALCVVHHTRKAIADDPLATVSGSYGLTGAADGVLVLSRRRNRSDASLSVIGRDVEEQELALEFKPNLCLWSVLGKAEEVGRSKERQEILDLLFQTDKPMAPSNIAALLAKEPGAIRALLFKMKGTKEIQLFGDKYQLPDYQPPETTKIRKPAKAKSVTALPVMSSAGNAPMSSDDSNLETERYRVTDVERIDEDTEAETVRRNGNAVTDATQVLKSKDIDALPAKNITGNTGNAKPLADVLIEMNDSTHRRRVTI